MITLYRGDDTGGQLGKNVKIAFHCDDAVNMDGVTVRFNLLNVITKEWTNVHDGDILEMFVTHEQSGRLPLGFLFGKIWGEDSSGKVRTFANRLPIIVTHDLRKVYGSDGLDSQDIHVYSSVDWDAIANKPTLFPSKIELVEGLTEALDGMVKSVNGKTADAAGAVTLTLDSFANKDGEIQVKQTLMVSRDGGQTFNAVATLVDVWNEIDSHNSSATAHANLMAAIANTYARKSDIPLVSTTFTSADAGKAADAKAVGDKIADCMTKVTTLKINDEWRFSVAPGLSGGMAIRLEYLDFPAQGIWGIRTEMTIPTGLGTLAKSSDIPEISTTFTSADAGKAADATAVGEALMGKVDAVAVKEEFLPITDVNETYDLSSYTIRKHDEYYSAYDASGNAMCSWRLDGVWMAGDSGIRFHGRTPPGDIPMLTFGATISDITDATKLTPVFDADGHVTGYKLGDKASPVLLTDDAKAALFAGADFKTAVESVFENGDEMVFGGAE